MFFVEAKVFKYNPAHRKAENKTDFLGHFLRARGFDRESSETRRWSWRYVGSFLLVDGVLLEAC